MSKCTHTVAFCESYEKYTTIPGIIHSWDLRANCSQCAMELDQDKLKLALERIYTSEITELFLKAYEHKKLYLAAISKLSENGIISTLFPAMSHNLESSL